ncbi:MAG: hypothetical protein U0457_08070 [Candidatus Sericytochromatia bacterium]
MTEKKYKRITCTMIIAIIFSFSFISPSFAENKKETHKSFTLEGGGFPLIGNNNGNINIKFGFNMENVTFLLLARQNYSFGGPNSVTYKDSNGNTLIKPVSQIYGSTTDFELQGRYYPLKKMNIFNPFITLGLGIELPSQRVGDWHIPLPVFLGNIGSDIMFNDYIGINLVLNTSFPMGFSPEINLKLEF